MAKKSVRREVTEIDPAFAIPDGVDELVHTQDWFDGGFDEADEDADEADDADDEGDGPSVPVLGRGHHHKKKHHHKKNHHHKKKKHHTVHNDGPKGVKKKHKKKHTGIHHVDDTNYKDDPETPDIQGIFSHTIRTDSTGVDVDDVVFLVSKVAGFSNYEIRVTKI